jgi:hypothetical protein
MAPIELRDPDAVRMFVCQGLWLQRARAPSAVTVRPAIQWALEIASSGHPLPPMGFVADVGHLALAADWEARPRRDAVVLPGVPAGLLRTYEDHVLGKLYGDWTFARASDALRRYRPGRDQARGLAFLIDQFRDRAGFSGVMLSPGILKAMLEAAPDQALAEGWQSLERDGPQPLLLSLLESLIAAVRLTAEVLGPEDLFELEHGTALREFGERVALRQVLQAAAYLETALPQRQPRTLPHRQQVPTRMLDEHTYPVGGFASLSNRGSIESLLQSQLAYMEKVDRPDLFDAKYLRDELLYYSRDENEFLRRRRTFAVVLFQDLVHARFKDAVLRWQRGILMLALLYVAVRKLCDWLSTDALCFVFFFPAGDRDPLKPERELLETLLREQIANQTVEIVRFTKVDEVENERRRRARRSLCHCLAISTDGRTLRTEDTVLTRLQINGPQPTLRSEEEEPSPPQDDDPLESWCAVLQQLLEQWIGAPG